MCDPRAEYTRRLARWDVEIGRGERRHQLMANLRLADAGAAVLLVWAALVHAISAWWLALPVVVFVALVVVHDRILRETERSRRARRFYDRGMARLDGTWAGHGADGVRVDGNDPLARDLDLFGAGSLFQLLCTARTEIGEETLAEWLTHGADLTEVQGRQIAVDDLRSLVDFRESLAVTAADAQVARTGALAAWAAAPTTGFSNTVRVTFIGLAGTSAVLTAMTVAGPVPWSVLVLWMVLQSGLALVWGRRVAAALAGLDGAARDLGLLKTVLERIEGQPFASPRLASLRDALSAEGLRASQCIARLERLVAILDSCRNQMVLPVALLFHVHSQLAVAIDRWHATHGSAIVRWLRAVGECEAFAALATFAFEHPADPFPELDASGPVFDAAGLGHPLIHESKTIRNDVHLGESGPHVLMVSGSNMSGKSTLLRAVGVNVVLALAGAPVRATRMRLSRVALGATLRVEDSLQEGHSKFYAEILRIRAIVDITRGPVPLLFLLDEILGGTNSYDRRIGAEAIIRALANAGAIGLVTTHDLALTHLVPALGVSAANVHFEDRIEDGKMIFDYRMRPGVVERSNALALMRAVGLDV
jgi:hypothetical protein